MQTHFLTSIAISIIFATWAALIARKLRQPLVLGYIFGGILLGQKMGLGIITDEASIEMISEIGLILLLFIIGLEINLTQLVEAGRKVAVTGSGVALILFSHQQVSSPETLYFDCQVT